MRYYPAYLDLRGRPCTVVGGGAVAERKTLSLFEAGAEITIISPTLTLKLQDLSASETVRHIQKTFEERDLEGAILVIAATDAPEVNARVAQACRKRHVLVNVAVPPDESSFIVPSVVARGELTVAISTGGASPALAKKIRQDLERRYGPEYELFLNRLAAIRKRLLEEIPDEERRRTIFQSIVDSEAVDLFRQGKSDEAEDLMRELAGLKP